MLWEMSETVEGKLDVYKRQVLWRPFHEAAGGWFWWGKDAASFKSLWIAMFNYFKTEGLDKMCIRDRVK